MLFCKYQGNNKAYLPLRNNQNISHITKNTKIMPHHIPALKIPSMALQLVSKTGTKNNNINDRLLFITNIFKFSIVGQ